MQAAEEADTAAGWLFLPWVFKTVLECISKHAKLGKNMGRGASNNMSQQQNDAHNLMLFFIMDETGNILQTCMNPAVKRQI